MVLSYLVAQSPLSPEPNVPWGSHICVMCVILIWLTYSWFRHAVSWARSSAQLAAITWIEFCGHTLKGMVSPVIESLAGGAVVLLVDGICNYLLP